MDSFISMYAQNMHSMSVKSQLVFAAIAGDCNDNTSGYAFDDCSITQQHVCHDTHTLFYIHIILHIHYVYLCESCWSCCLGGLSFAFRFSLGKDTSEKFYVNKQDGLG